MAASASMSRPRSPRPNWSECSRTSFRASVKTAKLSLVIGTRTSQPAVTTSDLEQAERTIDNRRQQLLYAIARMNGAKAVAETLAKRSLFFSSLPAMAEADKRDQDLLTSNAADLVPVETPWRGTPRSPLFLLETPYRQLIPFSLFDPGLERRQHAGDGQNAAAERPSWCSSFC